MNKEKNIISGFPVPQKDYYKVYVCSTTFNQTPYIKDCLNGVAMQETNFPFVHHVIDDASTDGEQDIIKAWMDNNCDMEHAEYYDNDICTITLVKNKKNPNCTLAVYFLKKNMWGNQKKGELYTPWREVCPYVASCEGDDYWIDPKKLQKQVDYLDEHPDVVYSCHRYNYRYGLEKEVKLQPSRFYDATENANVTEFIFDKEYAFTEEWITKMLTCVFRQNALPKDYAKGYKYARDVHMVYYLLSKGKGVYHSFVGGTYRYTSGGIFAGLEEWKKGDINYKVYYELYKRFKDPLLKSCAKNSLMWAMHTGRCLGVPANIIEYNVYKELLGINPIRLIKLYLNKYHKPLFN